MGKKANEATEGRKRNKSNSLTCTAKELKEVRTQELEVLPRGRRRRRRSGGRSRSGRTKARKGIK